MSNRIREQLKTMLQTQPREGGFTATLTVAASLSILVDHFEGQPLLPGMCMVQAVLIAAATAMNLSELHLRTLKNAKLMAPTPPGSVVLIDASIALHDDGNFAIKAKMTCNGTRCAEISLIASLPLPGGERAGVRGETLTDDGRSFAQQTRETVSQSTFTDAPRLAPHPNPLPSGAREPEGAAQ